MKLSKTQAEWMSRLRRRGRVRFGASFPGGMPERTAIALVNRKLVAIEREPVFQKAKHAHPTGLFVRLIEDLQ